MSSEMRTKPNPSLNNQARYLERGPFEPRMVLVLGLSLSLSLSLSSKYCDVGAETAQADSSLRSTVPVVKLNEFKQSEYDRCVFYDVNRRIYVCTHVDDLFIFAPEGIAEDLKQHLANFPAKSITFKFKLGLMFES